MTHRNHHEREFEAFLAGEESELARLYRRLPQAEPDPRLDAAVLNLARAAVEPQRVNALRHAKLRHPRPLWLVGLSSAAGVVLAAGIAWQMRNGLDTNPAASMAPASPAAQDDRIVIPISAIVPPAQPEAPAAAAPPPPPPSADSPAALAEARSDRAAPAKTLGAAKPAAPSAAPPPKLAKTEVARDAAPLAQAAPAPVAATPPPAMAATASAPPAEVQASPGGDVAGGLAARSSSAAAQPFSDTDNARLLDHNSVERKAAIATGSRRDEYGLSAEEAANGEVQPRPEPRQRAGVIREQSTTPLRRNADVRAKGAPPIAAEASPAAPPASSATEPAAAAVAAAEPGSGANEPDTEATEAAPIVAQDSPRAADTRDKAAAPRPETETAATPPASSGGAGPGDTAAGRAAALKQNAQLAPDEWIKRIQELLRTQRRDEALENLTLFRERHPAYVLPAELRDLR